MLRRALTLMLTLASVLATGASAADWPHLRGPSLDGRTELPAELRGAELALEPGWRAPIGVGYSGVAVADGKVVTMFASGDFDHVAAFDAESGKELWRQRLGAHNVAANGSDGGPLSTPTLHDGRVYALGAKGELLALGLADGKVQWTKQLVTDFSSVVPHFGFTTSPLVEAGRLIVLTGAPEGRAISGLDPANGEVIWTRGDGAVEYQSPTAMTLAGRRQVVTINGKELTGIDPASGDVLWAHALAEDAQVGSSTPTYAGEDRFLVFVSGNAVVFEVKAEGESFAIEEKFSSNALGRGYALPVYKDGHLYGYRGEILTCIDAETGERVWRSRQPGGKGLLLAGDHLVAYGAKGAVVLADATPEGYVELARAQALDASGYTWPSLADGRIFVRNLEELGMVSLVRAAGGDEAVAAADHAFGRFLAGLESSSDKVAAVEAYLAENPASPILEDGWGHFVYYGEADDMAINGTMIPGGGVEAMNRVAGTDLFYRSYPLEPGGRWDYHFVKDFEGSMPDPRNERTVPGSRGEDRSEVMLAGYAEADFLGEPTGARGSVEELKLESKALGMEREIQVYLPPGYAESEADYPLLIVHDGFGWLEHGRMAQSLDNLTGTRLEPMVVAFLKPRSDWWMEAGGGGTVAQGTMLAEELVPMLEERYRLRKGPSARALMGHMGYAVTSALTALEHPDVFGKVVLQSVQLGLGSKDRLMEKLAESPRKPVSFYLGWNRYESRNVDAGIDYRDDSMELAKALEQAGYAFNGGEALDSSGWAGWRSKTADMLASVFPAR